MLENFHQSHDQKGNQTDQFLFSTSKYIYSKGYEFIKKYYENSTIIIHKINLDKVVSFFELKK